jgi:hypothetical protein
MNLPDICRGMNAGAIGGWIDAWLRSWDGALLALHQGIMNS